MLLQVLLAVGLLTWIFSRLKRNGMLDELAGAFEQAGHHWPFLLLATAGFLVAIWLCSYRWALFLEAIDVHIPPSRWLSLYLVGQFFNAFMLGTTGGDFVKAYYVAIETNHKRTEVVTSVFIDRIAGMIALVMLLVTVMLVRLDFFMTYPETRVAFGLAMIAALATLFGYLVIVNHRRLERWPLFRRVENSGRIGNTLTRAYQAFGICFAHPRLFSKTLVLSLVNHVCYVTCAYYIGLALEIDLGFSVYLMIVPIISFVAALPITPSGLGAREQVAILVFGAVGVAEPVALTLSLLLYAAMLFWSVVGGIVYMRYSWKRGGAPRLRDNAQP